MARVEPQPGQVKPVSARNKQGGKNPVFPGSNAYKYTDPANNSNQIVMTVERRYISSGVMKRLCCAELRIKSEVESKRRGTVRTNPSYSECMSSRTLHRTWSDRLCLR